MRTKQAVYYNGLERIQPGIPENIWRRYSKSRNVEISFESVEWHTELNFMQLFSSALENARNLLRSTKELTLVGASAGASFSANIYHALSAEFPEHELRLICINGCLQMLDAERMRRTALCRPNKQPSTSYIESVRHYNAVVLPALGTATKSNVHVIAPLFDQTIPVETTGIVGATDHKVYVAGHVPGIVAAWPVVTSIIAKSYVS